MSNSKTILLIISATIVLITSCKNNQNGEKPLLESKIITDTVFSKSLNESRLLSIYLPKGYVQNRTYPVVYSADGQIVVEAYKNEMDSLIANRILPEFILVGVHSNEKKIPGVIFEYRNYEYIKGFGNKNTKLGQLYENHYEFFTQEVLKYVENKYLISKDYNNRIFYGISNGAGLGVSIGAENPKLFKHYICFSIAGEDYKNLNWSDDDYPLYYISYGNKEDESFKKTAENFDEFLTQNNFNHELSSYDGGHDRKKWRKEFFNILPRILRKLTLHNNGE